jgi:hypothetical protein
LEIFFSEREVASNGNNFGPRYADVSESYQSSADVGGFIDCRACYESDDNSWPMGRMKFFVRDLDGSAGEPRLACGYDHSDNRNDRGDRGTIGPKPIDHALDERHHAANLEIVLRSVTP